MKIAVSGALGRMGKEIIKQVLQNEDICLSAAIERSSSEAIGKKIDGSNIAISDNIEEAFLNSDAVIDFSAPENSLQLAKFANLHHKILVCGTTGFTNEQMAQMKQYASNSSIICSGNMSVGVNLMLSLVEQMARILSDYDIDILEMHHRAKVDAPSGTALMLGKAAAEGRHVEFDEVAVKSREGHVGARKKGEIGFATLRGGQVIGDHSVIFAGEYDVIEIKHISHSRLIYAEGAVRAAIWAKNQPPGFYNMSDVLGF